jgi:hypothetical protein
VAVIFLHEVVDSLKYSVVGVLDGTLSALRSSVARGVIVGRVILGVTAGRAVLGVIGGRAVLGVIGGRAVLGVIGGRAVLGVIGGPVGAGGCVRSPMFP